MIEHMFYHWSTKQDRWKRRLSGVQAQVGPIAVSVIRTGMLVALAVLLILGLLPAVLAAEAAGP